MTADNLSSIPVILEGDTIYFRRLFESNMESATVTKVIPALPAPLLVLSTGETIPVCENLTVVTSPQPQPNQP